MLRATIDPGSPYYGVIATPGNGVAVQWRKTQAGSTSQLKVAGTVPVYLEVARAGSTFTAYTSPDGTTWTAIPGSSVTLSLSGTLLAGLAVTSHSATKLGSATFDSVSLRGSAPPPPPNDFSIAATPGTLTVTAGGSGTTSVTTALVSGTAESIALSAGSLPAGVSAAFTPGSVLAGAGSSLTLSVGTAVAPGVYSISLTGTAPSASHSLALSLTVTAPSSLPSPWADTDVGAPALAGSATYAGGVFTLKGSGADIFGTTDQFNYLYQPVSGNGTIIARVSGVSNTSSNAKAGVIWKASTSAGSPYILIAAAPSGLVKVQYNFSGSITTSTYGYPNLWMKLVRSGSSFSAYLSPDGLTWTAVLASKSLPTIPTAATVGLFECSHSTTKLGTASFDNVSFTPGP